MSSFDSSIHQLAGSSAEVGGLILKSKSQKPEEKNNTDAIFKRPSESILGLDRLARRKREERDAEEAGHFSEKKSRLISKNVSDFSDSNVRISFGRSSSSSSSNAAGSSKERNYRGSLEETPTHTGGVSEEALQKIHTRLVGRDHRNQGVYASTAKDSGRRDDRTRR